MLSQFASREAMGIPVTLEVGRPDGAALEIRQLTDSEGFVRFDLSLDPAWDLPDDPAWEVVTLHWRSREGEQCVEGHVLAPGQSERMAVISDIDDTIIETGITGGLRAIARNWRRILAELPDQRIAAPGADVFYGALGGGEVLAAATHRPGTRLPATRRPFFYVSSSPWNLFSYLVAFLHSKALPLGPLMLRDWGFNRATLGSSSHGLHKRAAIEEIVSMYPATRFALIGDDTQGDLAAYAATVANHPDRIAAVFIRTSAGEALGPDELAAKAQIESAGVPLWLGDDYGVGEDFLHAAGFTPGGETEQIVHTVEGASE